MIAKGRQSILREFVWLALAMVAVAVLPLRAQQEKLYLKDGSYQLVKSYQIVGDRVRYYSLERSEWEEVPKSIVDFKATAQAKLKEAAEKKEEMQQAREIESQKHEVVGTPGFQIAPGVKLPSDPGVYAFDGVEPLRLVQVLAEVVTDKRRAALMLAMPAPLLKRQSLVILHGAKAAVRVETLTPVFYVEATDTWAANAVLIPLEVHRDSRVVERIDGGIGLGKSGEHRETIPITKSKVAPGIFKITPVAPLAPGEYALGEMMGPNKLNLDLWDFGIDAPGPLTHK